MESSCNHRHDTCDDENLLLDDDSIDGLKPCFDCQSELINSSIMPALKINTMNWINTSVSDPVLQSNSSECLDSPLLINDQYEDDSLSNEFHCHSKTVHGHNSKAWKKLVAASCLCLVFMVVEIIGGYIAGSLAVMTDAAHLFSDLVGFLVSIVSIWIGSRSPTRSMSFGYHRAEVLGAFISVLAVWSVAEIFCVLAAIRLWKNEYDIDATSMLIVASVGVFVNVVMGAILHTGHVHSHGEPKTGSKMQHENINIRAAAAHVVGDLLQSLGVVVAAVVIKTYPNAKAADPICTIVFSVIVVCATVRVAYDAARMLLEASPKSADDLEMSLSNIAGVRHLHELHVWSLSPGKDAVAAHLAVDQFCDRDKILRQATNLIRARFNAISCTIQVEYFNEELVNGCKQCQPLRC